MFHQFNIVSVYLIIGVRGVRGPLASAIYQFNEGTSHTSRIMEKSSIDIHYSINFTLKQGT